MPIFVPCCVVLLIISISYANEQETAVQQDNTRVSVYLHPVSLSLGLLLLELETNIVALPIYSTIEIPFGLSNSLIIKPSLFREKTKERNLLRLGSDIGIRHYLSGKGKGFYLQGQIGLFYYKNKHVDSADSVFYVLPVSITRNSWALDAMGYLGYSWKFSHVNIFVDFGFGAAWEINTKRSEPLLMPLPDINVGIGIPF